MYKRALALFLILCLGAAFLPGGPLGSSARAETYGKIVNGSVRLRRDAATNAQYWFVLPEGWVCTVHSETNAGGQHWYRVIAPHPDAANPLTARTYWGYIPESNFQLLTDAEVAEYLALWSGSSDTGDTNTPTPAPASGGDSQPTPTPPPGSDPTPTPPAGSTPTPPAGSTPTAAPTAASGSTGSITNGGTNFREGPGKTYRSLMKLDRGTVVTITSVPDAVGEDSWYGVSYAGLEGYVNSEFIRVITGDGSTSVTVSPTASPTPGASTAGYNAVQLTKTSAHLRTSPNGTYDKSQDWEGIGSILPLAGNGVSMSGYTWYPVNRNGTVYYVRGDCVRLISSSNVTAAPTSAPTATAAASTSGSVLGYVQTTKGGVNLRATIGGTTIKQIAKYVTLPYLSRPVEKNGYTWYYVDADGNRGYLRSDVVKVVSAPTPAGATDTPAPTADPSATGYVITTSSEVNLRSKAGYSAMVGRVAKGTVMPYYGEPTVVNGVTWYHVVHSTLGDGYIHGSYVSIVNADGSSTPTPDPTEAPTGAVVTATTSQVEASYSTLKLGSTGTAVKKLVDALKQQGYFTGTVTNRYTSAVEKAVKAFQRANNLNVDGIAGAATQHALYGTVPVGAADSSNLTITLYPAEKIDWWTGGINELWEKGKNYKIYDVYTGIVWWAHRWSGGYHVDAEPLTAADTARLCKCYGVTASSEITSSKHYQRRPCLVTIGTRTFACSLYGVPHNYPEGDTISTNDFKGQLCIHFTNSWTHGSKKVDSLHTEAIQYAYDNAPNGHK